MILVVTDRKLCHFLITKTIVMARNASTFKIQLWKVQQPFTSVCINFHF